MTRFQWSLLLIVCVLWAQCKPRHNSQDEFTVVAGEQAYQIPDAPRWVLDLEKTFTTEEIDTLNQLCKNIYEHTQHLVMIHTVSDFGSFHTFNQYAGVIDQAWADASQKYIIIIISVANQEIRIIYGTETEQRIPEQFTNKVLDQIIFPYFRNEKYYQGIKQSLMEYMTVLSSRRS